MTPFADAQAAIIAACTPRASEFVKLGDCAGRVLARDVIARDDLVPFARSAMDGFAACSRDLVHVPATLPIAGAAYAAPGRHAHRRGAATAIATGAAIPAGADCVIPIEDVTVHAGTIRVMNSVAAGTCIFPPGEDARRGDILVPRGALVSAAGIALLAAAGIGGVDVVRRPVVAVICGGDELVGAHESPGHGQIRDSNGPMLETALLAAGARVLPPVRLADTYEQVRNALVHACEHADLVLTAGGASVGERDFVKRACRDIGVAFFFETVALRPAKPTAFGRRGDAFVAVLPGNPAAAFIAFAEFAYPAVRGLGGHSRARLPRVRARLAGSINAKPGRHFAAFAAVSTGDAGFIATPLENQCSSLTRTAADGAGFIVVPPGPRTYAVGDFVDVDIFDWTRVDPSGAGTPAGARALALA